jgi:hypothetical protein
MLGNIGYPVFGLKRTAFGEIKVSRLKKGKSRELTRREYKWLNTVYKTRRASYRHDKHRAAKQTSGRVMIGKLPNLNWENATIVPWEEIIIDPSEQPKGPSKLTFLGEYYIGGEENQRNYWINQRALRWEFLGFLRDLSWGRIPNVEEFI